MFKLTKDGCVQDPEGTLFIRTQESIDWEKMPIFISKLSAGICPSCGSTQHQYKKGTQYILICQGCGKQE